MKSLPSLRALHVFEVAARLGSFQAAADTLNVSPTAISHHIRGLEAELNVRLFNRISRQVHLTDEGQRLARGTTTAFRTLETCIKTVRPALGRQKIRLALGPSIASRWLMPKLSEFWAEFPNVDLELQQSPLQVSPENMDADLFITWSDGKFHGMVSEILLNVSAIPVASPQLIAKLGRPTSPTDLLNFPLIHQRDTIGWFNWLKAAGVDIESPPAGSIIEDANVLLGGAASGQGAVLGWLPLINDDLINGRLVQLFDFSLTETRAYYLASRNEVSTKPIIKSIKHWLLRQAKNT